MLMSFFFIIADPINDIHKICFQGRNRIMTIHLYQKALSDKSQMSAHNTIKREYSQNFYRLLKGVSLRIIYGNEMGKRIGLFLKNLNTYTISREKAASS